MTTTSRRETFVVQPFWSTAKGLREGTAKRLSSGATRAEAIAAAQAAAEHAAGAVALRIEVAEDVDYCSDPTVIAKFGNVGRTYRARV